MAVTTIDASDLDVIADLSASDKALISLPDGVRQTRLDTLANAIINLNGLGVSLILFDTVANLLADTRLVYSGATGTQITVAANDRIRAGGFEYKIMSSAATNHHITTTGGVKLQVVPLLGHIMMVDAFGAVGDGTTDDSAFFKMADDALIDMGIGGTVKFTRLHALGGGLTFRDVTNRAITWEGLPGFNGAALIGIAGQSMGTFGQNTDLISNRRIFRDITIRSLSGSRVAFTGFTVRRTNLLRLERCSAAHVQGTAWRIESPFNAVIELFTSYCGDAAANEPAVLLTGSLANFGASPDSVGNDFLIDGFSGSEVDDMSWWIEHQTNIRAGTAFKLHGPCTKGMTVVQCPEFYLNILFTNFWTNDYALVIAEDDSTNYPTFETITQNQVNTSGQVNITASRNLRYTGSGTFGLVGIEQIKAGGRIVISGSPQGLDSPSGAAFYIKEIGAGLAGATINAKLFDPHDTANTIDTGSRGATVYVPPVT